MKNICFFNSNKVWGGGEKWHHDASLFFQNRGYRVLVITNYHSELFANLSNQKEIQLKRLRISRLSFLNILKIISIANILKENKIDTIILNLPSDVKVAGIAARIAGVKKIIYRRGLAVPVKNSPLNRFLFQQVISGIIANSEEIKRTILFNNPHLIDSSKIQVIYNGVDLHDCPIQPPVGKKNEPVILGNAGRLVEQKGQRYLIEVAQILQNKGVRFKLLIAGKGKLEQELKDYAEELGVKDNIDFLGFVQNTASFMNSIDIFLLSSLHEGSSNVVIEAMAYQKPVIAFNLSSNPEMIIHNETGYLVDFPDVADFAQKTISLIEDCMLRERFGKQGRKVVEENFNKEKNLEKLIRFI
ncbi:MAG: glycosyltransferase [bacterium]